MSARAKGVLSEKLVHIFDSKFVRTQNKEGHTVQLLYEVTGVMMLVVQKQFEKHFFSPSKSALPRVRDRVVLTVEPWNALCGQGVGKVKRDFLLCEHSIFFSLSRGSHTGTATASLMRLGKDHAARLQMGRTTILCSCVPEPRVGLGCPIHPPDLPSSAHSSLGACIRTPAL